MNNINKNNTKYRMLLWAIWLVTLLLLYYKNIFVLILHTATIILLIKELSKSKRTADKNFGEELETKYKKIYNLVIMPLEEDRKKARRKEKIKRNLGYIFLIAMLYAAVISSITMTGTIAIFILIALLIISKLYNREFKQTKEYGKSLYNKILPAFINEMFPGMRFVSEKRSSNEGVPKEAGLINELYSESEVYKQLATVINCNIAWENGRIYDIATYDYEGHLTESYYRGLFGFIPKKGKSIEQTITIATKPKEKIVDIVDQVEMYLHITTWDTKTLEEELTNELLEYYARMYKEYGIKYDVKFMKDRIYFRFPRVEESKIVMFDDNEYKNYLFEYYIAVKIMQETERILNEKNNEKTKNNTKQK